MSSSIVDNGAQEKIEHAAAQHSKPKPMRPPQVAARFDISLAQTYRLLSRGVIPGYRVGRSWRSDPAAIEKFAAEGGSAELKTAS